MNFICFCSGGIDSTFVLINLLKIGYNIIIYYIICNNIINKNTCSNFLELYSIIRLSYRLKVKYIIYDFIKKYNKKILTLLLNNLLYGYIINPDLYCNLYIKFNLLLYNNYLNNNYFYGHYIRKNNANFFFKSYDYLKDQSFFLSLLLNNDLFNNVYFPIGCHNKLYINNLIIFFNLKINNLSSTYGICLLGKDIFKNIVNTFIKSFSFIYFNKNIFLYSNIYYRSLFSKLYIYNNVYLYKKYLYNMFYCLKDSNNLKFRLLLSKYFKFYLLFGSFVLVKLNSFGKLNKAIILFYFNYVYLLFMYPIKIISFKQIISIYNLNYILIGYLSCDYIIF